MRQPHRGLTLVELIVTISILAMLLAIGAAILSSSTKNFQATFVKSKIVSLFKAAQQKARISRQYSWALFGKNGREFSILTAEHAAAESFDSTPGNAKSTSVQRVSGLKGMCGRFTSGSAVVFPKLKRYDERTGIAISFWLQTLAPCSRLVTVSAGPVIRMNQDNTISIVWGNETVTSRTAVGQGRWHHVLAVMLPFEMRLYVNSFYEDGVPVDRKLPETFDVTFGKTQTEKAGISTALFDEVKIWFMVNSQTFIVPDDVTVEFDRKQIERKVVSFDKNLQFILALAPDGKVEWDCPVREPIQMVIKSPFETLNFLINPDGTIQ